MKWLRPQSLQNEFGLHAKDKSLGLERSPILWPSPVYMLVMYYFCNVIFVSFSRCQKITLKIVKLDFRQNSMRPNLRNYSPQFPDPNSFKFRQNWVHPNSRNYQPQFPTQKGNMYQRYWIALFINFTS